MPKESIGHALHALNSKTHRFIDTYLHKRENDQLTGANTWVIHFIAEHRGSPVYLRDVERQREEWEKMGLLVRRHTGD